MKIQTEASNVLQRASANLRAGLLREKPVWFDVVSKYPPNHNFIKVAHMNESNTKDLRKKAVSIQKNSSSSSSQQVYKTRQSTLESTSRNNQVHRVPKLRFVEDSLRKIFYKQHPWELARPKNLIENSGEENNKCDWSHMLQLYKPLDGESVVQRTLWLMKNESNLTPFEAYDKARFEFYKLRMSEEMESHVAKEESSMYGGIIGSTNVNWNLSKEQEYIDIWTQIAEERTQVMEANMNRSSAPVGSMVEEEKSKTSLFEDLLLSNNASQSKPKPEAKD